MALTLHAGAEEVDYDGLRQLVVPGVKKSYAGRGQVSGGW